MADHYTQYSVYFDPGKDNVEAAFDLAMEINDEPEKFGLEYAYICAQRQDDVLWVSDDAGSGDVEAVMVWVRECGKRFKLTGRWGFEWANTCSKPRVGEFGGGVAVIDFDKDEEEILSTGHVLTTWLQGNTINA